MHETAGSSTSPFEMMIQHRLGELSMQAEASLEHRFTVLFGPSGSGKTTLLRVIAGLLKPQQACVRLGGRVLTDTRLRISVPPQDRSIGFVMQRPALFPHMSAEENVGFGLRAMSTPGRTTQVNAMLELFSATSFRKRRPRELSGGEQQRVALARALAPMPRLLLLDEPLTGMSSGLKRSILENLKAYLAAHSIPVIYVTHELPEVFALRAHVLVLEGGKITRTGPADEVLGAEREALLRQLSARASAEPVAVQR